MEKGFRPTWRSAALIAALILLYLMIFSFSAQDAATSSGVSGRIAQLFADPASPSYETVDHVVRKMAHAAEFAALFLVWHLLLSDAFPFSHPAVWYLVPLLLVAASASGDELSQRLSAGRACRIGDVFIDLAGASAMGLFLIIVRRIAGNFKRKKG